MTQPLPPGPFETIYCDPPWAFKTRGKNDHGRSAERHYPTMPLREIKELPVQDIPHPIATSLCGPRAPRLPHGEPPSQVVATKYINDTPANGVLMTRPLCPFPKLPQYAGSGDPTDAASFVCVDDGVHHNPNPCARIPEGLTPGRRRASEARLG
jgi:hypothetical protein